MPPTTATAPTITTTAPATTAEPTTTTTTTAPDEDSGQEAWLQARIAEAATFTQAEAALLLPADLDPSAGA